MEQRSKKGPTGSPPTAQDIAALEEAGIRPGLCATCRNARVLASRSSLFLRCAMAEVDPTFPRYPRLPVLECSGYSRREGT